jgi:hypothetical protein
MDTYALYRSHISSFKNLGAHLLIKSNKETRLNESGREGSKLYVLVQSRVAWLASESHQAVQRRTQAAT